ncbi:MAG: aminotransferase class III-fold pyridoxal phosphate-dependent enzyme, partial [Proteobacteria bacterium]|nr:aminotransferase class III-fold pyridoxal phosphate-dependent enzyme [Pseudomonadota bacterium]
MSAVAEAVAIVGIAGRWPDATSPHQFWGNLLAGRESITRFAPEELSPLVPAQLRDHPRYVSARGVIADIDRFDAAFFGISPAEALLMDPQQRIFLELCWNALEHAGVDPQRFPGSIGVYAGTSNNTYRKLVDSKPELLRAAGEFAAMLANEKDYVATRVAHRLDLHGPALSLHTACSTSLVAVAEAWYALMSWRCDLALAGGINIVVPQESGYLPIEGGMESEDGHCRPFDAAANGTVFSSGGAVVALKRLSDAQADGDFIWAVIRGVGVNNDGAEKASFTAPSVRGQAAVIRQALASADVSAESIGYVEAHGTGTQLGDPIEVEALTRAFREDGSSAQYCWIGSVKSNFGHLVAASGVTGLIKSALSLHHQRIPPTLHYRAPNPEIDFANSPFKVADRVIEWPRGETPRRAGVSSFGVGGTNAHVVLEEAPDATFSAAARRYTVLPLSAQGESALQRRAAELSEALQSIREDELPDVGYTLATGRRPMPIRGAVVASSVAEARERLDRIAPLRAEGVPGVVFLFPGQGSQHTGMAGELVDAEPVFGEHFERCCALASTHLQRDLRTLILPTGQNAKAADALLAETRYTQPALFAVEYALAKLWESFGIVPRAMLGHSSGEYVAAALAGVFSLEDAIALVCARGAAMFAQPSGAMLAVRASADRLSTLLPEGVEIAALNAPQLTVVSGRDAAIAEFESRLTAAGIAGTRLRVSHAYHSALMEDALPVFRRAFEQVRIAPPQREFLSCVTGAPITAEQATSVDYWCDQLRRPVQFSAALEYVVRDRASQDQAMQARAAQSQAVLLLEVGPGRALSTLTRSMLGSDGLVVASLGHAAQPGDAADQMQRALAECWRSGVEPVWDGYYAGQRRRRVPLPGYPFRGERYWIEAATGLEATTGEIMGDMPHRKKTESDAFPQRATRLGAELRELLGALHGEPIPAKSEQTSFLELGFDSLALTQAALEIERRYGLKLKFRRLMEDLDSIARLSAMLDQHLPLDSPAAPAPPVADRGIANADPALVQLIQSQMALMQQQSQLLAALADGRSAATMPPAVSDAKPAPRASDEPPAPDLVERPFGASARIRVRRDAGLNSTQRTFIEGFTRRYNARTAKSKEFTQRNRAGMADPRVVTGFNPLWKELVYPIVVERSRGARLWDIDGNEYIDLLNGFGANFLGYQPEYIKHALQEQIEAGFEIGPQHPLTAKVSALIAELTGMPRVALCNTGSEAVMGAMRAARTVTGRKTIAIFKDSYHGIFDEVIVRGTSSLRSVPAAPGILPESVANVLVLEYGSEESLKVLRERAQELAAVMIEPVQSRNPTLQPRAFVQQLRRICDSGGCALIFDEVITGFRIEPGGAQAFYGVRADLATYGKIIGGGLPFAAIAGSAKWMDALDGGGWHFGDDSYPEAGVTYFAGTFVRHPLALAAATAALEHVKQRGPALQRELNERTARLVARLNAFFATSGAPMRALAFSSLWRVNVDADQPCASLYYYALRERGLHLYEQFNCFLSEAHGETEAGEIAARIESAVDELMRAGALTPRRGAASEVADAQVERVTAAQMSIVETNPAPGFPLSDAQIEKWLSCQYGGLAELTCNESVLLTLDGRLDQDALQRALACVVARHEAFALSFSRDGGTQRINPVAPLALDFVDLVGGEPEARLEAHCAQELHRPFDLSRAPLIRAQLLRLAPQRHALLLVVHHLVFDGWSEAILLQELSQAYNAYSSGGEPELPSAESFRSYVLEERARRAEPGAASQLEYWKKIYASPPAPLDLPCDRPPTALPEFGAATERHIFAAPWVQQMRDAARREGVTLYALLLAGVGVLLSRLCNRHDFAIAVPFAGQAIAGSNHLIGDGVDTLPLRLDANGRQSFGAFVRTVHRSLLDAADNQDLTLFTLLRALPARGSEARRLGEIIFNLNPRVATLEFHGLLHSARDCAKVALFQDLFFNLTEVGEDITLDLHYHTALFDPETIRRWIGIYQTLLESAARDGTCTLAALPLLGESESRQALQAELRASGSVNTASTLPAMAFAQAELTPERTAVQGDGQAWSYARLAQYADAVARTLKICGVARGDMVGIHLPRRPEMLGALLGVMHSGAAYVPLDPTLPAERLRNMADRAEIKCVLTWCAEETSAALVEGRELLALESFDPAAAPKAELPTIGGNDLAYVMFTSGSTGQPKGVRVLHRNLANFVASMSVESGVHKDDVLCAVTTLSFDISGLELYVPLVAGARIVLASDEQHRDPVALASLLRETGATVLQTTPSLLRVLVDAVPLEVLQRLKLLIGGETLPRDLVDCVLPHCRELWNLYGPTETTIWSTLHRVQHDEGAVPLGKPIANTRVHVLDERRQPLPEGVIGEIWIGGAGVAEGYL